MAEKEEFELTKELLDSIAGLNELMSQQQDQAAAMLYRLMFRHERDVRVLDRYSDVVPNEYAPHKEMYDEECSPADKDEV